jgi:hypothetical protein
VGPASRFVLAKSRVFVRGLAAPADFSAKPAAVKVAMPEAPAKNEPGIEEGAVEPSHEEVRGIRAAVITAGRVVGHDVRTVVGSVIGADRSPPFATPVRRRRDSRQIFDDLLRDADLLQTDQIIGAGRRLETGPPSVEEREDRRVGGSTGRESGDLVENRT